MDDAAEPDIASTAEPILEFVPRSRPWLTIGLTLAVVAAYVVCQGIVVGAFLAEAKREAPDLDVAKWLKQVQSNGTLISYSLIVGLIVCAPLTLLFGRFAYPGDVSEVLGLRRASAGSIVRWTIAILAFAAATDGLTWLSGREIVPPFMRDAYWSVRWPALLWFAVVVAAPLTEELLFRGLMFGGLASTRLGFVGTALITSACFAALHVQYDALGITIVFLGGLFLAAARQSTGSIVPCLAMHAAMNLMATCEAAFLTRPA